MASAPRLPSFLVVGAAKSGTTALHHCLRQHPQVFMSRIKETNFFALDGTPSRFGGPRAEILNTDAVWRFADYARLFEVAADEHAVGEVCPRYLFTPGTAARIARRLPDVRIVAVLRHPAERAFSSFCMYKRDGFEPAATFDEAIADERRRVRENWAFAIHMQYGFYGQQLQEYFDIFPRERILCLLYEDFTADPRAFFGKLFEFIGVNHDFVPDTSRRHNRSGTIRNPLLRALWTKTHAVRGAAPLLPKRVRQHIARFFTSRQLDPLPFPPETRRRLIGVYHNDICHLQNLIGRDLTHWLEPAPEQPKAAV
jgi:hypothetical protein